MSYIHVIQFYKYVIIKSIFFNEVLKEFKTLIRNKHVYKAVEFFKEILTFEVR